MIQLDNQSPWFASLYPGWSRQGQRQQTLVVKIGFQFDESGQLTPLALPIVETDEYRGAPETSSLSAVSEIAPYKQGGEIYLYGSVQPGSDQSASVQVEIGLRYDNNKYWSKELRVFGPRHWERKFLTLLPSQPQPLTTALELVYEHAYGGNDPQHQENYYLANPAGCGFSLRGLRSKRLELPQLEQPPHFINSPGSRVKPAGFGPLPQHWEPRSAVKVNINQQGITNGTCPFSGELPDEMYNCAPSDQRFASPFCGPLTVKLSGLVATSKRSLLIDIPTQQPQVKVQLDNGLSTLELNCDTLVINSDERTLALIYRGAILTDPDPNGWLTLRDANAVKEEDVAARDSSLEQAS